MAIDFETTNGQSKVMVDRCRLGIRLDTQDWSSYGWFHNEEDLSRLSCFKFLSPMNCLTLTIDEAKKIAEELLNQCKLYAEDAGDIRKTKRK